MPCDHYTTAFEDGNRCATCGHWPSEHLERFSAHALRLVPQNEELVEHAARYGDGALVLFANPGTLRGNLGRRIRRHLQARGLRVTTRADLCAFEVQGR